MLPLNGVVQPEFIEIDEYLRLRAYHGNFIIGLPWYQNQVVYYNSEGITDKLKIPDANYVKNMYTFLNNNGELYFIEVKKDNSFIPIGDVALLEQNPPIVIGIDEFRGIGIGKKVLNAIISRAKEIGFKKLYNTIIYDYNIASQKLYESLGFKCVGIQGNEKIYELILS